jgi:hypothetical protein
VENCVSRNYGSGNGGFLIFFGAGGTFNTDGVIPKFLGGGRGASVFSGAISEFDKKSLAQAGSALKQGPFFEAARSAAHGFKDTPRASATEEQNLRPVHLNSSSGVFRCVQFFSEPEAAHNEMSLNSSRSLMTKTSPAHGKRGGYGADGMETLYPPRMHT